MKNNKSVIKRFKIKKCSIFRKKANTQHLLRNKSKNQLSRLSKQTIINSSNIVKIKKLITL